MKLLSRSEELVLLAVWRLKAEAYCVPIRQCLIDTTCRNWSFGAIYDPLDRLESKGFLVSDLSEPTSERGGRSKRIYSLTRSGREALEEMKQIQAAMWAAVNDGLVE
jgi:DNA-binding PadR family transcriptional regulator